MTLCDTTRYSKELFAKLFEVIDTFRPPAIEMMVGDISLKESGGGKYVTFSLLNRVDSTFLRSAIDPKINHIIGVYYAKKFADIWASDLERLRSEIDRVLSESVDEDGMGF